MGGRAATALLLFAVVILPGMVCGEGRGVVLRLEVLDAEGVTASAFDADEPVHLRIELVNHGEEEVRLPFSSGKTHDAIVAAAGGAEVWRWSQGRMFPQMLTDIALAPGASRHFEVVCDPAHSGTKPLVPGHYEAIGVLPVLGSEIRTAPVPITIR